MISIVVEFSIFPPLFQKLFSVACAYGTRKRCTGLGDKVGQKHYYHGAEVREAEYQVLTIAVIL